MKDNNKKEFGGFKEMLIVNSVTATRFIGSFLVVPTFKFFGGIGAALFSAIFLFTDFIDGALARKLKASTFFGALFDGATDKAFGIMCYALLMTINPVVFSIPLLSEIGIILVQNQKLKKGLNVKSNWIGKFKTWFLGLSIVGSFAAVDLLNMPPFLEYIKLASLNKVANIEDFLILMGIQLPTIVTQMLTLKSYSKEAKEGVKELEPKKDIFNSNLNNKTELNNDEDPTTILKNIAEKRIELQTEKVQLLQDKKSFLEKMKIIGSAMFDPEYYSENKDMPIKKLVKDLLNQKK